MAFRPDPAGVFESDVHRRVLGALSSEGLEVSEVASRFERDQEVPDDADFAAVLKDLKDEGYASDRGGWTRLKAGDTAIEAPPENVPPDFEGDALKQREKENREHKRETDARAAAGRIVEDEITVKNLQDRIERDQKLLDKSKKADEHLAEAKAHVEEIADRRAAP